MIPLSVPELDGNEWKYVKECIETGWISSAGAYVNEFEKVIADYTGAKYAVACVNGTCGLHIAQILLDVKPGDIVIVPNITFVATINAVSYSGATPLFMDVDEKTWQMDIHLLEEFLTEQCELRGETCFHKASNKKIAGVMPVHVLGGLVDMDHLQRLATSYHFHIIEDSTEALGSYYKEEQAGTIGEIGVYSFNGNKLISTGGGGMIVTDNESWAKRAKHITTQSKISPHEYIHDQVGYNYRLVNVLAAIGVAQMERIDHVLERKSAINDLYRSSLSTIEGIKFQEHIDDSRPNHWLFTCRLPDMRGLLDHLREQQIGARPFWMPMNQLPFTQDAEYYTHHDVSNTVYSDAISIPCSTSLSEDDQQKVIETILAYYKN